MVVPEAVWLLGSDRRRRSVRVAVGVVGLCGLALIPLAISQNAHRQRELDRADPAAARGSAQIVPQFLIGFQAPGATQVLEPWSRALVRGRRCVLLALRSDPTRAAAARWPSGAIAVGGLVLNLLLVAGGVDDLITRNVLALWLPAAIVRRRRAAARAARADRDLRQPSRCA